MLKYADVLVLMVFAYVFSKVNEKQVMKTGNRKYVNIRKIVEYLGTKVATMVPQIHAVTGYDATSSLHVFGKIEVFKKCLKGKKLRLLNTIAVSSKVSEAAVKGVEKEEKGVTETRVRLYKQMKTKISQSLPPDEKLMFQTFKRILFEVNYWSRVDEATISDIFFEDNGWFINNENHEVRLL